MKYTAIRSEGGLLPYDLLDEILSEIAPGQKAADFGLPKGRRVSDEIQRVWSDAQELWSRFKVGREKLPEKDPYGTTLTRDRWIGPLLTDPVRLSYDLHYQPSAVVLDGLTFAISHRAGEQADSPPVHIEGCEIELDKRPPKYRTSPQAMVQEFLNRGESLLWGVATNGLRFRLLRDSVRTARPTYLEFDLETILEGGQYSEFVLFYRLCHRTRLPQPGHPPEDCLLEKYYQQSIEKGGRVRNNLRDGVEEALKVLGTGFLQHPNNSALRERIDASALSADQFHRQLLLLVYRLLFLTVAEDRRLVISIGESADRNQIIYRDNYSIGRLRDRAEGILEDSGFSDLWIGLTQTFKLFSDSNDTNPLGIPPLNGDLFSHTTVPDLETAQLSNLDLLKAVRWLMFYRERNVQQRVNYAALNVEELGSVYESLLDFRPMVSKEPEGRRFELGVGSERKTTGSYYTRPELVRELIQSALVPVMEDRLAEAEKQAKGQPPEAVRSIKSKAILDISVCDPACGSGHFMLEAARRLGKELARVRVGEDEPTPEQFHMAVRDVISHCIHGVDVNPLAVDLCKLALWLEGHWAGKPLSFLDHRIRCGNSLIGVLDPSIMLAGIPDEAFSPVTGDDKKVAATYKKRNKAEKTVGQKRLEFEQVPTEHSGEYAELFGIRLDFPEDKPSDVRRKAELFEKARGGPDWWHDWTAANLWTGAFFLPLTKLDDPVIPTQVTFLSYLLHRKDRPQMTGSANSLAGELHFFHWHLEFPDVFEKGGFDVILGNPPWERIKFQEEEHWVDDHYVSSASNRLERARRIEEYRASSDSAKSNRILRFDNAKHAAEASSKFVRESNRFPLTAVGDVNTYALFAELARTLISKAGRAGIIVPTGIATDSTTRQFFLELVSKKQLLSYFGFKNEKFLFARPVEHTVTFGLMTMSGSTQHSDRMEFCWLAYTVEEKNDARRHVFLSSDDLRLINPNTSNCPIFRTNADAGLTKKLYKPFPVLVSETNRQNLWKVRLLRVFDMAKAEVMRETRYLEQISGVDLSQQSNFEFEQEGKRFVPVIESKLIKQYNHRYASYDGCSLELRNKGLPREVTETELRDINFHPMPRYWLPLDAFPPAMQFLKTRTWVIGYRNFARSTDERTFIASAMPFTATDFPLRVMVSELGAAECCLLLAVLNSLVFDYIVRQKVGGTDLSSFIVKQTPVPPPSFFTVDDSGFIRPRVLELCYTSSDMEPFAVEAGLHGAPFIWDESRRTTLRAELDGYIAHLYGLTRQEMQYILDPKDVFGSDFPSETFRVLKEREDKELGEYKTRRLTLTAFDELSGSNRFSGEKRECAITGTKWRVGD